MVAINFDSEGRIQMLQDDFILRQIREMVHAVMKMLFQVSASELTPMRVRLTRQRTSYTK